MVDSRDGVLPDQLLGRNLGAQVARDGAHVAMGQLEPRAGEGIGELVGVLQEVAPDAGVLRVLPKRDVGRGHHRGVALGRVMRIRNGIGEGAVLRVPLPGAGGALLQLPLVPVEQLEVVHVPGGRCARPRALDAAGDGVVAGARAVGVLPPQALLLHGRGLGVGAHVHGVGRAVRLAEGVTARGEREGLLVVHGHAAEGLADVACRAQRVGLAVGALGVHVDEPHLHGGKRVLKLAVARVALVAQPLALRTPVDVHRGLPDVLAAATESEGLEAHGLKRAVTGQDHEVGPRQLAAVLLLDRPQKAARLVEVGVVGPAVEGREALATRAGATAAVGDAVAARAVPGHADEQRAVVPEVGGPPRLRRGHDVLDVLLHRSEVERLELGRVIEALAHGVAGRRVLVKRSKVKLLRPPVPVCLTGSCTRNGARGIAAHGVLSCVVVLALNLTFLG